MGGSKKGEHRGNARKRAAKPAMRRTSHRRTHETPGEIMDEAVRKHDGQKRLLPQVIERRIMVARVINGPSGAVEDITPKEAMLLGMRHGLQAVRDLTDMLNQLASQPVTPDITEQITMLEHEIERQYAVAGEFAFKCAGFIHPKLQAIAMHSDVGANQATILQELFDEIDERERRQPIPIEHKPSGRTG